MDLTNLSSNWKKLQATLVKESSTTNTNTHTSSPRDPHILNNDRKRKRHDRAPPPNPPSRKKPRSMTSQPTPSNIPSASTSTSTAPNGLDPSIPIGQYIALDCEMVGLAPTGTDSALARISIVNYDGACIYDSHVLPQPHQRILDYRTHVSGVRPRDMRNARPFAEVQEQVRQILDGRVVVGHALKHDWAVLGLMHPREDTRDTSKHGPYRKLVGGGTPGLKLLVSMVLGLDIQEGEHSSLEDARAVMALFRRDKSVFAKEGERRKGKRGDGDVKRKGKYK